MQLPVLCKFHQKHSQIQWNLCKKWSLDGIGLTLFASMVGPWVRGHRMEDLIQQLERPMQMDLDPTGSLLDRLPVVVRAPTLDAESDQTQSFRYQIWQNLYGNFSKSGNSFYLDETQPEDAKPSEVVHADALVIMDAPAADSVSVVACKQRVTSLVEFRYFVTRIWSLNTCHGRRLRYRGGVGGLSLVLHLVVALTQVEHLRVGHRVDLVYGVAGRTAGLQKSDQNQ